MSTTIADRREYLDYVAATAFCGLSISSLQRLVREGKLVPHRSGRRVFFSIAALNKVLADAAASKS